MFADDTNFFYSHKNIKVLFYTVNSELENISQLFKAILHKNSFKYGIPLKLPALMVGSNNIEGTSSTKFLGVILDEHISWVGHV